MAITTNEKLANVKNHLGDGKVRVMIMGLGSVGNYLLSFLLGNDDERIEIIVAGRNRAKMQQDVNIAQVAALIRKKCRTNVIVADGVDLEDPSSIASCLSEYQPDIIVNTSRVYAGLKYGSISWANVRAYGIWTPLSVRYIRNIMIAVREAQSKAVVINTSYSDATIPWLKSAGEAYPDFGSGNLNHIIPRIKLAAAQLAGIDDFWNIEVDLATAHFHDVVISKEGQAEGVEQLLRIAYGGKVLDLPQDDVFSKCSISMPTDQKRNMMNASSNFDIIQCIVDALDFGEKRKFFSPGAFGEIGGYPIIVDGSANEPVAFIDESVFELEAMRSKNRQSIALDGVEDVKDGCLVYTDFLIEKAQKAFGVTLPKTVHYDEIDEVASFIVKNIIEPALAK